MKRAGLSMLLLLLAPALAGAQPAHGEALPVGVPAPLFALSTIDGQSYDMAAHLGRKPILLCFWSLFCKTCRDDIPDMQMIAGEWGSDRIEFVGVNIDGRIPGPIGKEMKERGYTFTSLMDEMSFGSLAAADPYGVDSTPVVFLIDRRGVIANAWAGFPDLSVIREAVRKVMEEK